MNGLQLFLVTSQQGLNVASYSALLNWSMFKPHPKLGRAESDGWLLGVVSSPSAPMHVLVMVATSFCISIKKKNLLES